MVLAAACRIKNETTLRRFAHEQFVAGLQRVDLRGQFAMRHQFEKELDFVFVR
jgi:hypothetical protein